MIDIAKSDLFVYSRSSDPVAERLRDSTNNSMKLALAEGLKQSDFTLKTMMKIMSIIHIMKNRIKILMFG